MQAIAPRWGSVRRSWCCRRERRSKFLASPLLCDVQWESSAIPGEPNYPRSEARPFGKLRSKATGIWRSITGRDDGHIPLFVTGSRYEPIKLRLGISGRARGVAVMFHPDSHRYFRSPILSSCKSVLFVAFFLASALFAASAQNRFVRVPSYPAGGSFPTLLAQHDVNVDGNLDLIV